MNIDILTPVERKYTYTECQRLNELTGCIGHLRADFGSNGEDFRSTWNDHIAELKSQAFMDELDIVVNTLRSGDFLKNRNAMSKYCYAHPEASCDNGREWGIRVDTDHYSYLMRLNPHRGEYNLYCYCYERGKLDRHLQMEGVV